MARRREVGIFKLGILSAALIGGLALSAQADDKKLTLSGSAAFTTDYMFRSVSQTTQEPAVQPEFDLTYGMWWAYMWGSNVNFPGSESIEIDYGAGISPKWGNYTFTIGGLVYTYPGSNSELDYFELKSGVAWASGQWNLGLLDYWSPDNFQVFGNSNAIEGTIGYAFKNKWLWNFFSPSISGTVGFQSYEEIATDYVYWNAGLTLGFLNHWSADVRYYDTNYSQTDCFIQSGGRHNCDARAVGTIKVTF
jgi:uncharacterized protein (TIGR02001 family)